MSSTAPLEVLLAQPAALDAHLDLIDAWRKQRLASVFVYKSPRSSSW